MGELILQFAPGADFNKDESDFLVEIVRHVERALQHSLIGEKLRRYTVELEQAVTERTQEVERRRQAAQGLREILRLLNANRSLGEVLNQIFNQAELLLGADAVAVFSPVDPGEPDLGPDTQIFVHSTLPVGLADTDFDAVRLDVVEAVRAGKAVLKIKPADQPTNYRAQLVAPVHAEYGVSGVVVFFFATETDIAAESIDLAVALGEQVMLATTSERLQQRAQDAVLLEERERLARELHDSVTQSIYSLTLFAEAGRRLASAGQIDRVQEYLTLLGDTAQQAMKQMRLMLYELRPAVLEQVGLVDALRQRFEAVEQRAGINARLEVSVPSRLPPAVEDGLYRICQEALNNALKHAVATDVVVRVIAVDDVVTLEISDNGIGFAQAKADELQGPGLSHIREHALRLNADLTIQTALNQGTIVRVSLVVPELSNAASWYAAILENKQ